jgi:hypothetical protein
MVLSSAAEAPRHESVEQLAYFFWLERGGHQGSPEEDWLRAEQHLRQASASVA